MTKDRSPILMAKELAELKKTLGTSKAAAEKLGISPASASRYLKLLKMPPETVDAIEKGEAPIRSRKKPQVEKFLTLNEKQENILDILARTKYATLEQISAYSAMKPTTLRQPLETVVSAGFVEKNTEYKPFVYSLSARGCIAADINKPKHFMSASAIHQRLMRNKIELAMQEKNASAKFLPRQKCWEMGLYPSIGEHAVSYLADNKTELCLVVIDDYRMLPSRTLNTLTRKHDEKKKVTKGRRVITWEDVIDSYLVYCTSEKHVAAHKKFISDRKQDYKVKPIVRFVEPVWRQ